MDPEALGAFLSGMGAVIGAGLSLWLVKRRCQQDCDRRIEEVKAAIHEGYELHQDDGG